MATLEKFFCLFALMLASFMSLLLCLVVSSVPVPRSAMGPARPATRDPLFQRQPDLRPRTPSQSFMAPGADER